MNTDIDEQLAISAADITRAAKAHLTTANRVVLVTTPSGERIPWTGPEESVVMKKVIAFFTIVFAAAFAQEPDGNSFRGMVRLNRAPVSNEVLKVKLPRPVERQLSNGLRLVILESHRAPTIALTHFSSLLQPPRRRRARVSPKPPPP